MLQDNLDDYSSYLEEPISDRPSERVRNALLLAIANLLSNRSNSSSGQTETQLLVPTLEIVNNNSGLVMQKAINNPRFVSIFIKEGTGTVLGTTVDNTIATIDFPYVEHGWNDIEYAVNPNSTFVVLVGR